jgi:hypothetical protein
MSELFIKVLVIVVAVILINWAFWHLVGFFTLIMSLLAPFIVLALIVFFAFHYFQGRRVRLNKRTVYRLWNRHAKAVYLFHAKPSLGDMIKTRNEIALTHLELAGEVFVVHNDAEVQVLEDDGSGAVKVKLIDPAAREKVGWVEKEMVLKPGAELSG